MNPVFMGDVLNADLRSISEEAGVFPMIQGPCFQTYVHV